RTAVEHYVGIDVSLELSSVCVVDGRGKIVKEAKVASEPEALVHFFEGLGFPVNRIGFEAGPLFPMAPCGPSANRALKPSSWDPGHASRADRKRDLKPFCWRRGT